MKKVKGIKRILAACMAGALLLTGLPETELSVKAATATNVEKAADPSTANAYTDMLGTSVDGARYAGRVWTDKSVFTSDSVNLGDGTGAVNNDANFMVVYSALGSNTAASTTTSAELDVVIILDNSQSMDDNNRLETVTAAANTLIKDLLVNEKSRLAVVTYSTDATTLLPLDYYEPTTSNVLTISGRGQMSASAVKQSGGTAGTNNDGYQRGTNLQSGIDMGMEMLEAAGVSGRTPVVIVLTDGVADYAVNTKWYDVQSSNMKHPSSNDLTPGVAFSTLLNAAYHKAYVEDVYGTAPYIYGIGVDLETSSEAHSVMDPKNYFKEDSTFADVRTAYGYYKNWSADGAGTITGTSNGVSFSFEQLPSTSTITKKDVIDNINYVDKYYNVGSESLEGIFKDIVKEISEKLLSPIVDTVVREELESSVPLTFVDFVGEYMEVKDFKAVTLFGSSYAVTAGTATSEVTTDASGISTRVITTPYVVGSGENVTNPALDVSFNISEAVKIELVETCTGTLSGSTFTANAVPEQEVWIYIAEEALPLWYSAIETENGVVTYTYDNTEKPVRVYYTVDVSDEILYPNGNINLHLVDQEYLNTHTVTDAATGEEKVYFYTNTYNEMNDHKENLSASYQAGEYGDAHASAMIADSNRYYYHQYNHAIYSQTSATEAEWEANEDTGSYGLLYYQGDGINYPAESLKYNVTNLTYADVVALNSNGVADAEEYVYVTIGFYRPVSGAKETVNADGSTSVAGEAVSYLVRSTWEEMKVDAAFYDTVNKVYINGIDSDGEFVLSETAGYAVDQSVVAAYVSATSEVSASDIQVYFGLGSWRLSRLKLMTREKTENTTQTAALAYGPTYNEDEVHVGNIAVWLGNNGRLATAAEDLTTKTVGTNVPAGATGATITDQNGKAVMVGDELTYYIKVVNHEGAAATATVTDSVPVGTVLVKDAADNYEISDDGTYSAATGVITWNLNLEKDETKYVSFTVKVTEEALNNAILSIENTASITIGNTPAYETNTVTNPPQGKTVGGAVEGVTPESGVYVGQQMTYYIYFYNDSDEAADITITDVIPTGTVYVEGTADHGGTLSQDGTTLTWVLPGVLPGMDGVVSFDVVVDPSAKTPLVNGATIQIGTNDPQVTNSTQTSVLSGDLLLSKVVTDGVGEYADKNFTLILSCVGYDAWNSTFNISRKNGDAITADTITFTNGVAEVSIKHGESILIKELPVGLVLNVSEAAAAGYTPEYSTTQVTITSEDKNDLSFAANVSVNVTNAYEAVPVSFQLKGSKSITTSDNAYFDGATFSILAQTCDENWNVVTTGTTAEVYVSSDLASTTEVDESKGVAVFGPKTISTPGTYRFLITEVDTNLTGVTYDTTQYRLTIVVDDNGSGQLVFDTESAIDAERCMLQKDNKGDGNFTEIAVASFAEIDSQYVAFSNNYKPTELTLELLGRKTLNGLDLAEGTYSFVVKQGEDIVASGKNYGAYAGAPGAVTFGAIAIKEAGEYTYTISEVAGNQSGVTYDDTVYTLNIKVEDQNGTLTVTSYSLINNKNTTVITGETALSSLDFTNSFAPEDVPLVLTADKILKNELGADITGTLTGGEYRFQVKDGAGEDAAVIVSGANGAYDAQTGKASVTFSPIYFDYDDIGTHTYYISEIIPDLAKDPSVDYDETVIAVTVLVTYDTQNGLKAVVTGCSVDGSAVDGAVFTNIDYPDTISVTPMGYKTTHVEGGVVPTNATFSFSVINAETGVTRYVGTAPVVNDLKQEIQFNTLDYGTTGTWNYWIVETNADAVNGITYDKTRYRMEVTITREGSQLKSAVTYYRLNDGVTEDAAKLQLENYTTALDANTFPEFNNTYNATGSINITAEKELTVPDGSTRVLNAGEFSFKLERYATVDQEGNETLIDTASEVVGTNDANGLITFATLYFSSADLPDGKDSVILRYKMSEIEPTMNKVPGVTYDKNVYYVDIKLTHEAGTSGAILAEVIAVNGSTVNVGDAGTNTGITFQNSYTTVTGTEITIPATKNLTGRTIRDGEFSFGLYRTDSATSELILVDTAVNAGNTVTFTREIPATATPGIYVFVIKEIDTGLSGVVYDLETSYTVYVKVTDRGDGTVAAELVKDSAGTPFADGEKPGIVFNNTYAATQTSFTPQITKTLTGRPMREGEFSFTVIEVTDPDGDGKYTTEGEVVTTGLSIAAAEGVPSGIVFTPITYSDREGADQEVTHRYVIKEAAGFEIGVDYATEEENWIYLAVTVKDDSSTGKLTAIGKYYGDAGFTNEITDASLLNFTNTYIPQNTTAVLEAYKTLTGRDLAANEFDFVVREYSADPAVKGAIVAAGDNAAATAGEKALVTFAEIGFRAAGTYVYTIEEIVPPAASQPLNGITFDGSVYYAVVIVSDDNNGYLTASEPVYYTVYDPADPTNSVPIDTASGVPEFVNSYVPAGIGNVTFSAHKTLLGKELKAKEFNFVLTDMQTSATYSLSNEADGDVATFPTFDYNKAGTYTYTLAETKAVNTEVGGAGTYTYDETLYTIVVAVSDDGTGQLKASTSYYKGAVASENEVQVMNFINNYAPKKLTVDLSAAIQAEKIVKSPEDAAVAYPLAGFEFEVTDITGKVVETGTSDENGDIQFTEFEFTQTGEYVYVISEKVIAGKPGITFDESKWEIHIHVSYDNETGKLYIESGDIVPFQTSRERASGDAVLFVNIYDPAPATLTITADKHLTGRPVDYHEFAFQLLENGVEIATARNDATGKISFTITIDTTGQHVYEIKEVIPAEKAAGVRYDESVKTVSVVVVEDYSSQLKIDGKAETTVASGAKFENVYTPTPVFVGVSARKVLNGAELRTGAFAFELVNESGSVVGRAMNDAAGNVVFDKLVFTKPDLEGAGEITRNYTIREVAGNDSNITYDKTVYSVKITVTDDMVGQLHAKVAYGTADGAAPVFTNTYTAPATPEDPKVLVKIEGTKALLGGSMTDGQFKFEIHDSQGILCNTGTSKADGTIDFYEMALWTEGKHVLTISEVNDGQKGIVYDTRKFEVVVDVYESHGTLRATVYYPEGGVAFVNRTAGYVAPATGDNSPIMLLLAAIMVCGCSLSGLFVWRRKKVQK